MAKGSAFERDICRQLSLWWSDGKDDDLFWRSSMSGGRATVRKKKGKRTIGHNGDIAATSNRGRRFTQKITVEIKRGYNRATLGELIDRSERAKDQIVEQWIQQAKTAAQGTTKWWIIIHQRDRREPIIYMPRILWHLCGHRDANPSPFVEARVRYALGCSTTLICTTLANFFRIIKPIDIRNLQ